MVKAGLGSLRPFATDLIASLLKVEENYNMSTEDAQLATPDPIAETDINTSLKSSNSTILAMFGT
eukprot:4330969-Prymnesium_polylepis.1